MDGGVSRLMGGYECEFIKPTELQTECSICLSILRDPYLVDCCGYSFCHSCIRPIISDRRPCPLCKKVFGTMPDKRLQRELSQKEVYCSKKHDGCDWVGKLADSDDHLNTKPSPINRLEGCRYVSLPCRYCTHSKRRGEIETHEEDCPRKPYTCEHCGNFTATRDVVSNDHYPTCSQFPLECSNECGRVFARCDLDSHMVNACPMTAVNCDFHYAGCDAWLMRRDLSDHLAKNVAKHASLSERENRVLMLNTHQLNRELADIKRELDDTMADCRIFSDENLELLREREQLREQALADDCDLKACFDEVKEKESQIKRLEEQLWKTETSSREKEQSMQVKLSAARAECKEKDTLCGSRDVAIKHYKASCERKDRIIKKMEVDLDDALVEATMKESLLTNLEQKCKSLEDELSASQHQQELTRKEMDSLKTKQERELKSLKLELDNRDRMILESQKLVEKLKSKPDKDLQSSTGTIEWPEPLDQFEPYEECPEAEGASSFVPYNTYSEQRTGQLSDVSRSSHASSLSMPEASTSSFSMPEASASSLSMPGASVPSLSMPGASVPSLSMPGASVPSLSMPGTSVSSQVSFSPPDTPVYEYVPTEYGITQQRASKKHSVPPTVTSSLTPPPGPPPAKGPPVPKTMDFSAALKNTLPKTSSPTSTSRAGPNTAALRARTRSSSSGSNQIAPAAAMPKCVLMIRNTPSRKRGVTDKDIIDLFCQFGRVCGIDRKGSNTALVFDNWASVQEAIVKSEGKNGIVCGGVKLYCGYAK